MTTVELLWFEGCPNHVAARQLIEDVLREVGVRALVEFVEVPDLTTGDRVGFPGSPTIRVDGLDIEPGFEACEECTPRCRIYATGQGLTGLPERSWLERAVRYASASSPE
jgi:hypothetical protein